MGAVNKGKLRLAVICIVVCGSGLLLWLLGLRGAGGHAGPSTMDFEKDAASGVSKHMTGQDGGIGTGPLAPDSLRSADVGPLAGSGVQTLAEILDELPIPGISTRTGNPTNLMPAEETRAIALWDREASRWKQLREFSGNIDIDYLDSEGQALGSLRATIRMRVHDVDPKSVDWTRSLYPPSYEMILTGPQGRWTYTCDGTRGGSKLVCQDEALAGAIKPFLMPGLAAQIWEPSNLFLHPGNRKNPNDPRTTHFWQHHQPMKHPELPGEPDCYLFAPPIGSRARNLFFLENGRLTRAVYGPPQEKTRFEDTFEGYEQVDGFAFPAKMSHDNGQWKRVMTFSDVKVELAADK